MALSTLFDDFPVFDYGNGPRRRRIRPFMHSVLDTLEDQIGNTVGQVFRILPALAMELDDDYERCPVGRKRKLRRDAKHLYEPKSKVLVTSEDGKFKVSLDTSNYQPEEITVKVVDDKLAISAKHEAKSNDVYEYCEMYRSFDLPDNVDPSAITSHLSSSGQLTVEAPLKALPEPKERNIPVEIVNKEKSSQTSTSSPTKEKSATK